MTMTESAARASRFPAAVVPDPVTSELVEVPDPLERARRLGPLLRAASDETELAGTMPDRVVKLLKDANLFWVMAPPEIGGDAIDLLTALAFTEEMCSNEASIGWSLMANMNVTGYIGAVAGEPALKALFLDGERAIFGGMYAPMGRARPADGGVMAGGRFAFGSGTAHSTWIGGGAPFQDEHGSYDLMFVVPRSQVIFKGNWDVLGLVGTGSYDYEIPEQFIPDDYVYRRFDTKPLRGPVTQRVGLQVIASAGHSGVALGMARRALEELHTVLSAGKARPGQEPVIRQQLFRHDLAITEGRLRGARAYVLETLGAALDTVIGGDPVSDLQLQRVLQASTLVTKAAYEMVEFAYLWSGSKGLRTGNPLARLMRDMHAATQHVYVDESSLTKAGPLVLESYARTS